MRELAFSLSLSLLDIYPPFFWTCCAYYYYFLLLLPGGGNVSKLYINTDFPLS